ncbi:MAG: hypothetical protein IJT62_05825 [Oscillospiraceae bacterium]|nr:hypothetical protein [Oscillospiraceae bacterium]
MDPKELYAKKLEVFQKTLAREEADWVPSTILNAGGSLYYVGKNVYDFIGDHAGEAKAITAFLDEMWLDVNFATAVTCSTRVSETFTTAENRLTKDGTLVHLQTPFMQADEYDQLIADPAGFVANVLLPRKYPYLYENREKTKELLKIYAEGQMDALAIQGGTTMQYLAEHYGVPSVMNGGCQINTPLDHIFDYFRGFRGTLTDLRRQPDKVKAALDAIWDYQCAPIVAQLYDPAQGMPFQPCHVPPYLSPKQYEELCWPYEKRFADWITASGGKIVSVLEGRFGRMTDCFLDAPKDSFVLFVDDDDIYDVNERLGQHHIIAGGLLSVNTRMMKIDEMKDGIMKLIDTLAPGGGYIFAANKCCLTPGDVNRNLIDCYNFAHEYSKK